MGSTGGPMLEQMLNKARKFGFSVSQESQQISINLPGSPIQLHLEQVEDHKLYAALYLRTSSWDWPGERSDLHDAFSLIAASFLAETGINSCALLDVPHPAIETREAEIFARFIAIAQPSGGYYSTDSGDLVEIEKLIEALWLTERFIHLLLPMHPPHDDDSQDPFTEEMAELQEWAVRVARALGESANEAEDTYSARSTPQWLYYRCAHEEISVFECAQLADAFLYLAKMSPEKKQRLPGVTGDLILRGPLSNYASSERSARLVGIASKLTEATTSEEGTFIALENVLIFVRGALVVAVGTGAGRREFDAERERVFMRHQNESAFLFPVQRFTWSDAINGGRFQNLVQEILQREPGVSTVRSIGGPNEGDGGRDHIADWVTPIQEYGVTEELARKLTKRRRVVVQCKALKASVGKSKIPDLRDILEDNEADGYLLVASGEVGVTAADHLLNLRKRMGYFTDWWGRAEIEDRLRKNPDIALRYTDVVVPVDSPS
ncbi:restriction endonuclease [Streptomyces sp. NPDC088730]|uniref:restriction endonuclease n=1 Tax=Streptomyces sp. NPDC088730 TaxID=3365877 RepID=UPI00382DE6E2